MKKKAEVTSDKSTALIIAIIVLAVLAIFLFRADINRYLKDLIPEYSYSSEDAVVDVTGQGESAGTLLDCPYKVAKISGSEITFCENGICSGSEVESGLLFNSGKTEIWLDIDWSWNKQIAIIHNNKIILLPEAIDWAAVSTGGDKLYREITKKISDSQLKSLEGAYLKLNMPGGNFICRDKF